MKNHFILISFDLIRADEPAISYSMATILAYLKSRPEIAENFTIQHICVNLFKSEKEFFASDPAEVIDQLKRQIDKNPDWIAISEYVWSRNLTMPVVNYLKELNPDLKVILGGYEISANTEAGLLKEYPFSDYFVKGYAEVALKNLLTGSETSRIISGSPHCKELASPYLSGEIKLNDQVKMVRWETKRGCPYKCSFCEWSQVNNKKIEYFPMDRLVSELNYFAQFPSIKKINLLDGTFNMGHDFLDLMDEMGKMPTITFSIQTRIEAINQSNREEFLEKLNKYRNIKPEIGIQTIIPSEMETIGRIKHGAHVQNELDKISKNLLYLRDNKIDFKVDLIYGIPGQTKSSFEKSFKFLLDHGAKKNMISTFPLRIPRNSKIWGVDSKIKVSPLTEGCPIDIVTESESFEQAEWKEIDQKSRTMKFEFKKEHMGALGKVLEAGIPPEFQILINNNPGFYKAKKMSVGIPTVVNNSILKWFFPVSVKWRRINTESFQKVLLDNNRYLLVRFRRSNTFKREYGVIRHVEKNISPYVFRTQIESFPNLKMAIENLGYGVNFQFKVFAPDLKGE